MSALSVNQQMFVEIELKMKKVEAENAALRAQHSDTINAQLLEQEQTLQERQLEIEKLTFANERLTKQIAQLTTEKETLITKQLDSESQSNS